jgi:hypothetical protein
MSHNKMTAERGGTILRVILITVGLIVLFGFLGFDLRGFLASGWMQGAWQSIKTFIGGLMS